MNSAIYTERLLLRKMIEADSSSLYKIWSDPDVTKFMNIECFTEERQTIEMITYLVKLAEEKEAIRYSIIERKSNQIIGSCGYNYLDYDNAKAEIGYDLAKSEWGKGYGTECVSALLNYAFHILNFNRVEARVEPENVNSIKVLLKLNFKFEGTLRKSEKSNGNFIDINIYSKLTTD